MKGYKAVMFAPDGDWVTDYSRDTKEEVISALADRGSRWFFYPFDGVIADKGKLTIARQRVIEMAPPLEHLTGKAVSTISELLKAIDEHIESASGKED